MNLDAARLSSLLDNMPMALADELYARSIVDARRSNAKNANFGRKPCPNRTGDMVMALTVRHGMFREPGSSEVIYRGE